MKNVLRALIFSLFAIGISQVSHAQTGTLPAATPVSTTVPWTLPSNCTSCQFQIYRCTGLCTVTGTGWTLIATSAVQAISYKDTTVTGGTQYTYDVEAIPSGSSGSDFSGPSNAGSITVLFTPLPPVIGIVTSP